MANVQSIYGECEVITKEQCVEDPQTEYVGFSWVEQIDPVYGKEEFGYLVYRKGDKLVAFEGYEGTSVID